uniref:Uncharacterized protein n=1 Tax=Zea mays TaxID=4577 RepID=C4J5H8_MAIZE|nr:unknown [Zea mays]
MAATAQILLWAWKNMRSGMFTACANSLGIAQRAYGPAARDTWSGWWRNECRSRGAKAYAGASASAVAPQMIHDCCV